MERRRFLATVASATGLTLAGCTGSRGGPADGDESPGGSTDTTVPGDTATESPTASPTGSRETDTLSGSPPGNGTESPDEPPMNDTETGTIDGIDYALDVTDASCRGSDDTDSASITFDAGAGKVVVEGAITTSDLGEVATVSDLAYDDGSGHLAVTIGRRTQDDDGVSGQCLAIASYEARFRYPEQLPDRVTVTHEGQAGTTEVVSATSDGD
jgi:hypothetical protein